MSARIVDVEDGLITLRIQGVLDSSDLRSVQAAAKKVVEESGKVRVLVLAEEFGGWSKTGDWGNLSALSVQAQLDTHIERMAIVGEQKWEDLALMFAAQGLRPFPVEYFHPEDIGKARRWLAGTE